LLRVAAVMDRTDYRDKAKEVLETASNLLKQYASGFGRMLAAVDFYVGPSKEIAIVGDAAPFLPILRSRYLPRAVVAMHGPLMNDRPMIAGKPTAYVCENFACKQPVTDAADFDGQVSAG